MNFSRVFSLMSDRNKPICRPSFSISVYPTKFFILRVVALRKEGVD